MKLIFDEIPTGLGKTGKMFSCEHDGVTPDILVLGKALGGGILPIAAIVAKPEFDVAQDWAFGHYTHEKNPVTTRAALATIDIIEDEALVENAAAVGAYALGRLQSFQLRRDVVRDVRGRGLLIGFDVVAPETGAPDGRLAEDILYRALDRGLSFKTTMGHTITLTPPLVTTRAEMEDALDRLEGAIDEAVAAR